MPRLDWQLIARRALGGLRICGYSDATPLLLETLRRTGQPMLHGPMVAVDLARGLDSHEAESFVSALHGDFRLKIGLQRTAREAVETRSGRLLGGCLSLLVAVLGTPYQQSLRGSLAFFEDVEEPLYRRDRMLTHLHLSGSLIGAEALLFGHFSGPSHASSSADEESDWHQVIRDMSERTSIDTASGLPVGHAAPNWTLAVGAPARLDPDGTLRVGRLDE